MTEVPSRKIANLKGGPQAIVVQNQTLDHVVSVAFPSLAEGFQVGKLAYASLQLSIYIYAAHKRLEQLSPPSFKFLLCSIQRQKENHAWEMGDSLAR